MAETYVRPLRRVIRAWKKDDNFLDDPRLRFFRDFLGSPPNPNPTLPAEASMDNNEIRLLQDFVHDCSSTPSFFDDPSLVLFFDFVRSLGFETTLAAGASFSKRSSSTGEIDDDDDTIVESDLELDTRIVEPDTDDPPQKMGDTSVQVSEQSHALSLQKERMAMEALSKGNLEVAVGHLTEAILLNPLSAILYSTRASVFIRMKKPVAAICDADAALQIDPDSAKGYITRGVSNAMLGRWVEAARDLYITPDMDYDDEIKLCGPEGGT